MFNRPKYPKPKYVIQTSNLSRFPQNSNKTKLLTQNDLKDITRIEDSKLETAISNQYFLCGSVIEPYEDLKVKCSLFNNLFLEYCYRNHKTKNEAIAQFLKDNLEAHHLIDANIWGMYESFFLKYYRIRDKVPAIALNSEGHQGKISKKYDEKTRKVFDEMLKTLENKTGEKQYKSLYYKSIVKIKEKSDNGVCVAKALKEALKDVYVGKFEQYWNNGYQKEHSAPKAWNALEKIIEDLIQFEKENNFIEFDTDNKIKKINNKNWGKFNIKRSK